MYFHILPMVNGLPIVMVNMVMVCLPMVYGSINNGLIIWFNNYG